MTTSTAFIKNRSQAIKLPTALRLPDNVMRVDVHSRGCERVIATLGQTWDSFFLSGPQVADGFMSERASQNVRRCDAGSLAIGQLGGG